MSPFKKYGIATGGIDELRAHGLRLVDPATREPLDEIDEMPADADIDEDEVLVGMRSTAPGRQVPGTKGGYECQRCTAAVRLAPSGQRVAARGMRVWCIECFVETEGAS